MNRLNRSVIYIARFTLEARTALSIGTGGPDGIYDHPIVRDANGLPMIPGTSLAGVLRALTAAVGGDDIVNNLFGWQASVRGAPSCVEVAACALQDSAGRPIEGLLLDAADRTRLATDRLLRDALATQNDPLFRDRVRLTHRGVAAKNSKYDRGLLAAGHRFSGEIRLWSEAKDDHHWSSLLDLLAHPLLRLGGATRAGMGAMALRALHVGVFDLREPSNVAAYRKLGSRLHDLKGLDPYPIDALSQDDDTRILSIELTPRDFWRFGQGNQSLAGQRDKVPDLLPMVEPIITWSPSGQAQVSARLALVPGSSIKGALAHRTAFHWNALNQRYVDDLPETTIATWDKSDDCDGVREIFGYAKGKQSDSDRKPEESGQAGHLIIDDVYVDLPEQAIQHHIQTMIHNSLDRFTGGVRNRMLFTEELVYRCPIPLRITLLPGIDTTEAKARRAFSRAVRDLCDGRLSLGAGTTKGHGSFSGVLDDTTRGWLDAQEDAST
ncbi:MULTISPECIES: RAMP superfamily CRISPR-associated protein [unclassified Thiocapsa]|uniref:RAMP superfamily CRISPR-associated protein n=1 Tax=unclassified Thiocapsa TaxID=2641286 RepID=UPI0035B0CBF3